jgi:hypothetical protein
MLHPLANVPRIQTDRRGTRPEPAMRAKAAIPQAATALLQRAVGNQAVLRMLAGEPHDVSRSSGLVAGPLAGNGAISGVAGGPIVQRQDAGGADTTMTNAPPTGGAGATQAANVPWSTNLLDATIDNANNPQCLGSVQAGGGLRFSTNCGTITGPFCQPAGVDFNVDFSVDVVNGPRPAGFTPPTVRVQLIFVNSAGAVTQTIDKKDTKPKYNSPGTPLDPAFGHDFPFSTSESGWLHIHLQLADPDTGATVDYNDRVTFTVTPCM